MKSDMAGAATVLGTVKAMAIQKAPVNLVAIMPMAENMVSGHAMIPGDVIKTAQGLTVEVLNTDAEGRLAGMPVKTTAHRSSLMLPPLQAQKSVR